MVTMTEGAIITLDAHTTDLLEAYTAEHNAWLKQALAERDCPFTPFETDMDEVGRHIITRFLHDWAYQRKGGKL